MVSRPVAAVPPIAKLPDVWPVYKLNPPLVIAVNIPPLTPLCPAVS